MAQKPDERAGEPAMDPATLYREEIITDRKVGTIRVLAPVKKDGTADASRAVLYFGEAQLLTSVGTLPINFELEAQSLEEAVSKFSAAAKDAEASGAPAPVVLLSPACASYDQFPNFEVRGDVFRKLVSELPGVEMRARRVP